MINFNHKGNNFETNFEQKITPKKYIEWEKIFNKYLNLIGKVEDTNEIEQLRLQNIIINKGLATNNDENMQNYFTTNAHEVTTEIFKEKIMVERILLFYKDTKQKTNKGKDVENAIASQIDIDEFEFEIKKGFNYDENNVWLNCDLIELENTYNSFRDFVEQRNRN